VLSGEFVLWRLAPGDDWPPACPPRR